MRYELRAHLFRRPIRDECSLQTVVQLLKWFKEFFRWTDAPDCECCQSKNPVPKPEPLAPTPEERRWGASRVEGYTCRTCHSIVRFPRYNDPVKLLETRNGRCGEWANCFTLCAIAAGYDARLVLDKTDHVWTEVFSKGEGRWLHCDPCETICDKPLVYKEGWGKKLTYCLAFAPLEVADVTWRYTTKFREIIGRRTLAREPSLGNFILSTNKRLQSNLQAGEKGFLTERYLRELVQFLTPAIGKGSAEEQRGRTSGSLTWRLARGETTVSGKAPKDTLLLPDSGEISKKEFKLTYSCAKNTYSRPNAAKDATIRGWKVCLYSAEGVARKEEMDWRTVYLAREEGRNSAAGELVWKIDLRSAKAGGANPLNVSVKATSKCFENGTVDVILCAGDQCAKMFPGQDKISLENIGGCEFVQLKITLSGGRGDNAWQHAQLFRTPMDVVQNDLEICIKFQ